MTNLKLYVWPEFFSQYTNGLAFAIAESEAEAKALIVAQNDNLSVDYESEDSPWGRLEVCPISKLAFYVCGGD